MDIYKDINGKLGVIGSSEMIRRDEVEPGIYKFFYDLSNVSGINTRSKIYSPNGALLTYDKTEKLWYYTGGLGRQ